MSDPLQCSKYFDLSADVAGYFEGQWYMGILILAGDCGEGNFGGCIHLLAGRQHHPPLDRVDGVGGEARGDGDQPAQQEGVVELARVGQHWNIQAC